MTTKTRLQFSLKTLLVLMLIVAAYFAYQRRLDLEKAQGTWNVVRHASNGLGFGTQDGDPLGPQVFISGGKITLQYSDRKYEYVIKLVNDKTKPKHIDLAFEKDGRMITRRGIYLLEKETIKCEFASPGESRPTEFEAAQHSKSPTNLLILRRARQRK